MKILNTSSDFFYPNLTEIVQKRSQYNLTSVKIRQIDKK